MITLHHLENSRSQRILWLLEELGLEYTIQHYKRNPKTMLAPPELKKIHPLGKSPLLTDGDLTLAESGAIVEHLVDTYGEHLKPEPGTPAYQRYRFWMHYAEGSLMPPLLLRLVFNQVKKAPVPFFIKPITNGIVKKVNKAFIQPQLDLHLGYVDNELRQFPWFAGEMMSGADFQMSFPLEGAAARVDLSDRFPHITEYLSRIRARPAYIAALDKGGPFKL
ncbi:MAG: glutathione S-transferase [Deltaproteobacteria bacterium]|nr:MAG: glutathione S-transferase [Deltaproteobacteria bacterium]